MSEELYDFDGVGFTCNGERIGVPVLLKRLNTRTEDKQAEKLEKIIAELGEQSERYENDAKKYSDMCDEEFSRAEKLLVENLEQAERIKELEAKIDRLTSRGIEDMQYTIKELEQQLLTAQADGIDGVIREYERSQMSIASKRILVIPALINFMKEHASNIRNKASEGE